MLTNIRLNSNSLNAYWDFIVLTELNIRWLKIHFQLVNICFHSVVSEEKKNKFFSKLSKEIVQNSRGMAYYNRIIINIDFCSQHVQMFWTRNTLISYIIILRWFPSWITRIQAVDEHVLCLNTSTSVEWHHGKLMCLTCFCLFPLTGRMKNWLKFIQNERFVSWMYIYLRIYDRRLSNNQIDNEIPNKRKEQKNIDVSFIYKC